MTTHVAVAASLYVLCVLAVGWVASRRGARTPDDYFLAGRGLGTLVLFMALFGTNATAFVLVGIPGQAYHDGIGTFGVNAPIIALGIPLSFALIGAPARRMAGRLGALTPAELYARRFGSRPLGALLFLVWTAYTLPYMVTTVKGAVVTLSAATEGLLPDWAFALAVLAVALAYTALGGMRATAWTNVLQGVLFLAFMTTAFFAIAASLGGLPAAFGRVAEERPELLVVDRDGGPALFAPGRWATWGLVISLTVIAFPHMLVRLMAARGEGSLRTICRLYPLALVLLWVPAVTIGVWGAVALPGLEGRASDEVLSRMAALHLPPWLAALAPVAVLAAAMSTLDAMILTLSSMLVRDVLDPLRPGTNDVLASRVFALLLAAGVWVLALAWGESVFGIARFAFEGYVTLAPVLFLGVRWRRLTAAGAATSVMTGSVVLAVATVADVPEPLGAPAVLWAFVAATAAALGVSLATEPADARATAAAFGD